MSGQLIERLQHHQERMALATQQQNRQRSNPPLTIQMEDGTGANGVQQPKSAAFFLRRNISEFQGEQQEFGQKTGQQRSGINGKEIAILPKGAFKQVSFLSSPRGSTGNESMAKRRLSSNKGGGVTSSLENASTALGINMVKSPVYDRRHLRTRGTANGTESFDFLGTQPSSRGVFSSFSKSSFPLNNVISQPNLQSEVANGFLSPQPSSVQTGRGMNFTKPPPDDPNSIWNRHTFSYTVFRMRPKVKLTSRAGLQSDYLDKMQKNKIEKLMRFADEEKNRVQAKKDQLETLKTELQMIRLLTGNMPSQDNGQGDEDGLETGLSPQLQESLRLSMLRPDFQNKGCQLTSFAASMNIHDNLTQTDIPTTPTQQYDKTAGYLRTPALMSNAPDLGKSIYQTYYPMTYDDETISANLHKMKDDLETKLKDLEFKHKSEFFVYQQLDAQRIKENKEITSLTFRHRDVVPEQNRYEKAIEQVPLIKMLSDTAKEQQKNLLTERKNQLDRKRDFFQEILSKKVTQLKVHSKEIDALQAAIGKRQLRIDEMKEHLQELKENNKDEEVRKQDMIASLINKNLEFKVLSGIEVIVKLEEALNALDSQKSDHEKIEDIKKVRTSAMSVDMLSKKDLEGMNVKKIEKLKFYEQHFSKIFPDVKQITINDTFLQKRYDEISISIHSKTEKYQELVQLCHVKKKLIKQYTKFKNQVELDRKFLESHSSHHNALRQNNSNKNLSDTMKSTTTLNDMRCAEFQLKRGLVDQDHQVKLQIIAQACTFVTVLMGRYSYILREIFQMVRFEQTLPGTERDGPQQIALTQYLKPGFLTLIQKFASKFALENMPQIFNETPSASFDRRGTKTEPGNATRSKVVSPDKKKRDNTFSPTSVTSQGGIANISNGGANGFLRLPTKAKRNMLNHTQSMQIVSGATQSLKTLKNSHTTRRGYDAFPDHSQSNFAILIEAEQDGTLENFDLTTMEDLKVFLDFVLRAKEQNRLLEVSEVTINEREFQHKLALKYIKQNAVLSRLCEYCQITQEMGIDNVTILMNGLDFKAKNPKLRKEPIEAEEIKTSRRIGGNKDLHDDFIQEDNESDTSDVPPEEDYVDPDTKHIINDVLMADKKRYDMETRRKKREKEREKLLKKMSDAERREQNKIRLQRQIAALQLYQKDEHSFRAQFKNNLADVFNNDLPKEKETKKYVILDGQALSSMANTTLKNQRDPYKHYPHKLPEDIVGITSQPDLQRAHHKTEHHRILMSSQSYRTQQLKNQGKKIRSLQNTVNDDINSPNGENESMMSMSAINAEPPKGMSAAAAFKKIQAQRLLERQQQRRSVVKINKPQETQPNIVLQLLQEKFPELEQLFMTTAQRRNQKRSELNHLKSAGATLLSSPNSPNSGEQQLQVPSSPCRINNSSANLTHPYGSPGIDDDTTQLANTAGGYNSDDQLTANAAGVPGPVSGFAYMTHQSQEEEEDLVSMAEPIIKVKPVYPRGVFK